MRCYVRRPLVSLSLFCAGTLLSPGSRDVAGQVPARQVTFPAQETLIGTIQMEKPHEALLRASDKGRVAWIDKREKNWVVVIDGVAGPEFEKLDPPSHLRIHWPLVSGLGLSVRTPVLSRDGSRIGYAGKREDRWSVVVDGAEGPEFEAVSGPLFSSDGQHVAYVAHTEGYTLGLVLDGEEAPKAPGLLTNPVFSPDGQRFAYVTEWGNWSSNAMVIADGVEGAEYDRVGWPLFSADGTSLAYYAKRDGRWTIVVDGEEGPLFKNVLRPVFSPDSRRMAYGARKPDGDKKWVIVVDGAEGREFDAVGMPSFSPDSRHVAYFAKRDKRWRAVVDGEEQSPFREVLGGDMYSYLGARFGQQGPEQFFGGDALDEEMETRWIPVYTAGGRLFYFTKRDDDWMVVVDGEEHAGHRYVGLVLETRGGEHLVYMAYDDETGYVEIWDGEPLRSHALEKGYAVSAMVSSKDGQRVAIAIRKGGFGFSVLGRTKRARRRWIIDGEMGKEYDVPRIETLEFGPDSRHVAYVVERLKIDGMKGEKSLVVLDGVESRPYDQVAAESVSFTDEGHLTYVVRDGSEVYRVVVDIYRDG